MNYFVLIIGFLFTFWGYSQGGITTIDTQTGNLLVNKSDNSLAIYGNLKLTEKSHTELSKLGLQNQKAKIVLHLSKECKLENISVVEIIPITSVNEELKVFSQNLVTKIKEKKLESIFQFDNELGFVNQDSCSDNLSVSVTLSK